MVSLNVESCLAIYRCLFLTFAVWQDVMETICRLVRVLQCPHECGHALLISQGSPGISTNLAQLAAHLCGYSVFRINSSSLSAADRYTLDSFKADLVSAYTRAGVKVSILLILLIVFGWHHELCKVRVQRHYRHRNPILSSHHLNKKKTSEKKVQESAI